MTRTGKIARLPRHIRDELNRRIDDGELGIHLVAWLNAQPGVKHVLNLNFGGRPISEQNLTEWKQGGYLDWQKLQAEQDRVLLMAEGADQIEDAAGLLPLSDRIATMASLALGKVIQDLGPKALTDKQALKEFFRAIRELSRLRHEDLKAAAMYDCFARNAERRRQALAQPCPASPSLPQPVQPQTPESDQIRSDQTKNETLAHSVAANPV